MPFSPFFAFPSFSPSPPSLSPHPPPAFLPRPPTPQRAPARTCRPHPPTLNSSPASTCLPPRGKVPRAVFGARRKRGAGQTISQPPHQSASPPASPQGEAEAHHPPLPFHPPPPPRCLYTPPYVILSEGAQRPSRRISENKIVLNFTFYTLHFTFRQETHSTSRLGTASPLRSG